MIKELADHPCGPVAMAAAATVPDAYMETEEKSEKKRHCDAGQGGFGMFTILIPHKTYPPVALSVISG